MPRYSEERKKTAKEIKKLKAEVRRKASV